MLGSKYKPRMWPSKKPKKRKTEKQNKTNNIVNTLLLISIDLIFCFICCYKLLLRIGYSPRICHFKISIILFFWYFITLACQFVSGHNAMRTVGSWEKESKHQVWQLYARWISKNMEIWKWQVLNVKFKYHWYFLSTFEHWKLQLNYIIL